MPLLVDYTNLDSEPEILIACILEDFTSVHRPFGSCMIRAIILVRLFSVAQCHH